MQKKNNKGVIALIIVLVLAAAALVIWQTNKPETQQGGKEITVNVDHLNGDDTTFTIHTDEEYLRGALEQEDLIEGTESEYGLYVLTVDGETADESEQQWWGYSVNGTFAELGVDSQPVADGDVYDCAMIGYRLENTVTENGHVARGICQETPDGFLHSVVERTHIEKGETCPRFTEDGGNTWQELPGDTVVSMNLWGFTRSYLDEAWARFPAFLEQALKADPMKAEYYLPTVVSQLLADGKARVKVLRSHDKWYGVTYQEDKPTVVAAIAAMTAQGLYPENLWSTC